ncbi:MAG: hypothetical protein HY459_00505 [Parcubacteria group bacterium]|nr:hypothetical protein [Parcubacteria group bacterium]
MFTGLFILFQRVYRPSAVLLTLAAIASVALFYLGITPLARQGGRPTPSQNDNTPQLLYRHENPITLLKGGDGIFFLDNTSGQVYRLQGGEALLVSDFKIFPGQRITEISRDGTKVIVLDEREGVDPAKVVIPTKLIDLLRKRVINLPPTVLLGTQFSKDGTKLVSLIKPSGSNDGVLVEMNLDGVVVQRIVSHPFLRFAALGGYFPTRSKVVFTDSGGGILWLYELSYNNDGTPAGEPKELVKNVSRETLLEDDNSLALFTRTDFGASSPKLFAYNRISSSILFTEISGRIENCAIANASATYCFDELSQLWQIDLSKPFPQQVSQLSAEGIDNVQTPLVSSDGESLFFVASSSAIYRISLTLRP